MRRLLLGGAIAALLAGCGEEPEPPRPPAPPRVVGPAVRSSIDARGMNLLVILSDTHRADFTSPQDGGRQLTPTLELLARDGIRFPHAYTITPTSAPSYASLLSGLHPEHHGLFYNEQSLSPEIPLLSEQLRADGYTTAAVIGNGYCSARYGFDRGWDWCWNGLDGTGSYGPGLTDRAIDWLDRRDSSKPFFLFTTYMECHVPFLFEPVPNLLVERNGEAMGAVRAENGHGNTSVPIRFPPGESVLDLRVLENGVVAADPQNPSQIRLALIRFGDARVQAESFEGFDEGDGYFRRIDRHAKIHVRNSSSDSTSTAFVFRAVKDYSNEEMQSNYERGVRSMDREVGRLLAALEARGLTESTVVVFLADHGEMLGEHDAWGHLKELYEEDIRIPLVLRIPGGPRGGVADRPVDLTDVHGALRRLLAETGEFDAEAQRFFPFDDGARTTPIRVAAYPPEMVDRRYAVIWRGTKLLVDADEDRREMYDLRMDPQERRNLWDRRAASPEWHEMRGLVEAGAQALRVAETLSLDGLSEEAKAQLEALGYTN